MRQKRTLRSGPEAVILGLSLHSLAVLLVRLAGAGARPEGYGRIMPLLASACQTVEREFNFRCFSPQYEILLLLYELNRASPGDLLMRQRSAGSTFYKCINSLQQKGLIIIEKDHQDRRYSLYSLTDFARGVLDEKWNKIQTWTRERATGESGTLSEP